MACPGSKSSIDLPGPSAFVQSMDPAGASQLGDFLDVRDCRERPGGLGEEAERLVFVVMDRLKCLIQVSAARWDHVLSRSSSAKAVRSCPRGARACLAFAR